MFGMVHKGGEILKIWGQPQLPSYGLVPYVVNAPTMGLQPIPHEVFGKRGLMISTK
jgi:hypothetical protein